MGELLTTLNLLGWMAGAVALVALFINRSMRRERQKDLDARRAPPSDL